MDVKRHVDIIRVNPQDWPDGTPAWKEEDPDLGSAIIPGARYTSEAFMALEWERMWSKVWLLGGRSEDMAEPGDPRLFCYSATVDTQSNNVSSRV